MKAIISRADESGNIPEVGAMNRIVVTRKSIAGIRKYAKVYADGRPHRIEFYTESDWLYHRETFQVEDVKVLY